ncbi:MULTISPECIES: cyclodeaminase/cyclohydrolase family protein [unclassified Sedimentibacter]|uniref:cyclodeaminase/cyclohydrolase family protein n=1 Tax=unclassified Sedimentibacter TaxID=2649220 RepID=UPI0027E0948F|nr:cyclodeaminase/cyclohydrolase family protein [Sedimentibacter sp. MB35-C1]WMJ78970.1 cyclodeaminase/cyclohydrolase family protein [Sedimentibacter sp. MB35-C1]
MKNMTLEQFANVVSSNEPVPGGGSVAAVCGMLSAALSEMVANLTIGKKKYAEHEKEMLEIKEEASQLKNKLMDYIEKDSNAYNMVMDAYRLPKETQEEKETRKLAIEEGSKLAAAIPLEVAHTSYEIMHLAEAVVLRGNSNAVTDALVAAMLTRTAVLSALLNVRVNLSSISDEEFAVRYKEKSDLLEAKVLNYEKKILEYSPF